MNGRFNPRYGLVLVRTHLWGPAGDLSVVLALDTGASYTMIDQSRLMYVGYDPASSRKRVQIASATGVEFVPQLPLDRIGALGKEMNGLQVLAHTLPASIKVDGLLGLDFLRNQRLAVDFRSGIVTLD